MSLISKFTNLFSRKQEEAIQRRVEQLQNVKLMERELEELTREGDKAVEKIDKMVKELKK